MRRRELLAVVGMAMLPLAVRAQQRRTVGVLFGGSINSFARELTAIREGLAEAGNAPLEIRSADGDFTRLATLAEDLVGRRVAVIISASNAASAVAAKAATRTIPIVFYMGADPIALGIVESLSRPGGNITGVTVLSGELMGKRLELLHELVPSANKIAYLTNPANPSFTDNSFSKLVDTARGLGLQLVVLKASKPNEVEEAFATSRRGGANAMLMGPDTFFQSQRGQIVSLAARHALPVVYTSYEDVAAGGLIGYGSDFIDAYHQVGVYVARILNGEDPKNLPVQQATKFRLAINLKTATQARIEIPPALLARADTVIE